MKVVRLVLHQSSAHYHKEETIDNRMTYPLPPVSTIIGAIHNACGYTEYHPMKISIQGKFESMGKKMYTDYCFLNSLQDDRGTLVKMKNETMLSKSFEKVASAKKSQGNSFKDNKTIQIYNEELLLEYQELKKRKEEIQVFKSTRLKRFKDLVKKRKATLAKKKKQYTKNTKEYISICNREAEVKNIEKEINDKIKCYEDKMYIVPMSKFRTLTTAPKYYEILHEVTLILHISAAEQVMEDIIQHQYDLTSIGRSEDFVTVNECKLVELQSYDSDDEIESDYAAYISANLIRNYYVTTKSNGHQRTITGTKYLLNRDYSIVGNKRVFNKCKVIYTSQHRIEQTNEEENLFYDSEPIACLRDSGKYIVNLL